MELEPKCLEPMAIIIVLQFRKEQRQVRGEAPLPQEVLMLIKGMSWSMVSNVAHIQRRSSVACPESMA